MAVEPYISLPQHTNDLLILVKNGHTNINFDENDNHVMSETEDDSNSDDLHEQPIAESTRVAIACDDGSVRLYSISSLDKLMYLKTLTRVSGRILSMAWCPNGKLIYSGTSDGFIRCWDVKLAREIYRTAVGLGGLGSGSNICILSLLALGCGTLVSAVSTGMFSFGTVGMEPHYWCILITRAMSMLW